MPGQAGHRIWGQEQDQGLLLPNNTKGCCCQITCHRDISEPTLGESHRLLS